MKDDLDDLLDIVPIPVAEEIRFDGRYRTPSLSLWRRINQGWEEVGSVYASRGKVCVQGKKSWILTGVTDLRVRREPFPWLMILFIPWMMFGMYELELFRSMRPDEPFFWIIMAMLLSLCIVTWRRSRLYDLEYIDEEGNIQSATVMPLDHTRKALHPNADRLFKDLYETVLGRSPTDLDVTF